MSGVGLTPHEKKIKNGAKKVAVEVSPEHKRWLFEKLDILQIEDVAAAFNRSPETIRNWIIAHKIPAKEFNGNRYVVMSALREFLATRKDIAAWE